MRSLLVVALSCTLPLAAQTQWRRFAPLTDFEPVSGIAAYEPISAAGYWVGRTATSSSTTTWRHVDGAWIQIATANTPPLPSAAATWPGQGILLVASGQNWRFDGTAWTQLSGAAPSVSTLAFDPLRNRIVGFRPGATPALVWEFDGSSWLSIPFGIGPTAMRSQMAWHSGLQRVVALEDNGNARLLHAWDGANWTFVTAVIGTLLGGPALAAEPGGAVLSVGGWDTTFAYGFPRLWASATPIGIATLPDAPPPMFACAAWFDSLRQQTVVAGLRDNWSSWTWNGTAWAIASVGLQPPSADVLAYDSWRGQLMMPGGESFPSEEHGDVWARRDNVWSRRAIGGITPRQRANIGFDAARGQLLSFGGAWHDSGAGALYLIGDQTTRAFDGAQWLTLAQPTASNYPAPRHAAGLAFDRGRKRLVMFGGLRPTSGGSFPPLVDTWEWDGSAWLLRQPTTSPPAGAATMAYDGESGQCWVVASGWTLGPASVQSWDGTTWTLQGTAPFGTLVEDPARGALVLLAPNAQFERQGSNWVQIGSRAFDGNAAFDLSRGAIVGIDWRGTVEFGDPAAATIQPVGTGCAGALGEPVLHAEVPPRLGRVLPLRLERIAPTAASLGLLGAPAGSYQGLPLPIDLGLIGMPGCALETAIDATAALLGQDWPLVVPVAPTLQGAAFRLQALTLDALANPFGAILSNAVALRIGS